MHNRLSMPLMLFLILSFKIGQSKQLRYYRDLEETEDFSTGHYVTAVDSLTPGGGGWFVWYPADLRPGLWGIRFKSNQSGKAGSWVRQFNGPVQADWFGARHLMQSLAGTPPTFKELGYSEDEIRRRFTRFIPDISVEDTPDYLALRMCMVAMENGYYHVHLGSDDFFINRSVTLPEKTRPTDNTIYRIDGSGCTITSTNKTGYAFFESMPDDQRQGLDIFTSRRFLVSDIIFRGQAAAGEGGVAIRIGGTFHSAFENIHFANLDTGIVLRHAMSSEIIRCNAVNCYKISYFLGSGAGVWPGADAPNSGSNQSRVIASRVFTAPGQYAGVYISNSSECRVIDLALDGGLERNIAYAVYINTGGTTTVKDGYVQGIHGEAGIDSALVKFRGNGNAMFRVSDLFIQMKCTIVELEAFYGYAQVNCSDFSYIPPGSSFANRGNGGAWSFTNVFNKAEEIKWKTGKIYSPPVPDRLKNVRKLM